MRSFLAIAATLAAAASSAVAATVCNGDASLCDRLYSNVTYIGTHNSYSVGSSLTNNQLKDVTAQLVRTASGRTGCWCLAGCGVCSCLGLVSGHHPVLDPSSFRSAHADM